MKRAFFLLIVTSHIFFQSCSDSTSGPDLNAEVEIEDNETNQFYIIDRTGKRWDVTHAKEKYGMIPEKFQYGLGPNAIRPIIMPNMLSPGEHGYPSNEQSFLMMGTSLNGFTRAYPLSTMSIHEVVDEKFGDAYVAVAY